MKRTKRETKRERKARLQRERPIGQALDSQSASSGAEIDPIAMMNRLSGLAAAIEETIAPKTRADVIRTAEVAADASDADTTSVRRNMSEPTACQAGCNYCCRGVRVDVAVPEVARIVDNIRTNFDSAAQARVQERAQSNALLTHGKSLLMYPVRLPCALLGDDGLCSVYSVRPVACRSEHSRSAEACKRAHDLSKPGDNFPVPRVFQLQIAGSLALTALTQAMNDAMGDHSPCELQEALHIALSQPEAVDRWLAGDDAFASARSNDEGARVPRLPRIGMT